MAWIDARWEYRQESGSVVNSNEIVYAVMTITNNLPWPLTNIQYQLTNVTGEAHLEPREEDLPKRIVGGEILPGGSATQEFVLKAENEGNAGASMKLEWDLAGTGLTFEVAGSVEFPIHPS